ncbi:MAG TPA: spermidine synthase [Chloroflexota bacterium]|nr:spermidine synthase [Chloroflexota bacterium]
MNLPGPGTDHPLPPADGSLTPHATRAARSFSTRRSARLDLFLCSFTILFVELVCIRWIPAYIRYLGYFRNFVLLGSFLGIGLGILQSRRRIDLQSFFPLVLALLVVVVSVFRLQLIVNSSQEVFFGITEKVTVRGPESFFLLPLIFTIVTLLFLLLGQNLGRLLASVRPPLTAYTVDIMGSIAGTAVFALISFLGAPPGVWFGIAAVAILALPQRGGVVRIGNAAIMSGVVIWVALLGRTSDWSPYYRIDVQTHPGPDYSIFVNNIGHQGMGPYARIANNFYYATPFQTFRFPATTRELIIGAGSGSDVDMAIHHGIRHITAVELDPTIYDLGRRLNPDHVYQNPAVHAVIDDGRSFLEKTHGSYDLVVFALPDSLALTSSFANLRLESYLFTQEAFQQVRRHLSSNGLFVLYNNYRTDWVMRKIAGMLSDVFGRAPYGRISIWHDPATVVSAVLMDGPRLRELSSAAYAAHRVTGESGVAPATDDWPFVYLKTRSIPVIYLQAIAVAWIIALLAIGLSLLGRGEGTLAQLRRFDASLFFMGVAFLLLEAKSIVNFTLLFGATWLVNALVIVGILCTVLLANWITARAGRRIDLRLLYAGLAATLLLNLLLPFDRLLVPDLGLRYLLGCVVLFSPILLANLIFGRLFGDTALPDIAFASNLLGAFMGGTLEYASLQIGYHLLLVPVMVAYACSFLTLRWRRHGDAAIPAMVNGAA